MQLPTPEQQFVLSVQGAPSPLATHVPSVVEVVLVVVVTGGIVVVVVGANVVVVVESSVVVVVGARVVVVVDDPGSEKLHSAHPMRSWPYWFQTGFLPPVMFG